MITALEGLYFQRFQVWSGVSLRTWGKVHTRFDDFVLVEWLNPDNPAVLKLLPWVTFADECIFFEDREVWEKERDRGWAEQEAQEQRRIEAMTKRQDQEAAERAFREACKPPPSLWRRILSRLGLR